MEFTDNFYHKQFSTSEGNEGMNVDVRAPGALMRENNPKLRVKIIRDSDRKWDEAKHYSMNSLYLNVEILYHLRIFT